MTVIGDDVNQPEEHSFPDQRCQRPAHLHGTAEAFEITAQENIVAEAEKILIRRLAEMEEAARRHEAAIFLHDGTILPFVEHEQKRGLSPKSINNVLGIVSTVLNRAARVWRDVDGRPWLTQAPAMISRLSVKGAQAKPYHCRGQNKVV